MKWFRQEFRAAHRAGTPPPPVRRRSEMILFRGPPTPASGDAALLCDVDMSQLTGGLFLIVDRCWTTDRQVGGLVQVG